MPRALLAALALVSCPASAQALERLTASPEDSHQCVLLAAPSSQRTSERPTSADLHARAEAWVTASNPEASVVASSGAASTFVVTYTGFGPYPAAQAAFQAAVDVWADHLASTVPIRVNASFAPLGANVLGSAGPRLTANFSAEVQSNVWYPFALADAMTGVDLFPADADIEAQFSSSFSSWHFDPAAPVPGAKYDFFSVVLHELGHGLGFIGSGTYDETMTSNRCGLVAGNGCWGVRASGSTARLPQVFDQFVEAGNGTSLLNTSAYGNPSAALGAFLRGQDVWAESPSMRSYGSVARARLHAPASWQQGSSFSHFDEASFGAGTANALMSPQIANGERAAAPGPLTCAFFSDMGWPLGPGCSNQIVAAEERLRAPAPLALALAGENPFRSGTRILMTLARPQAVDVALFDATGRRVQTVFSGEAAGELALTIQGDQLAAGLYAVRAVSGTTVADLRVVRVR